MNNTPYMKYCLLLFALMLIISCGKVPTEEPNTPVLHFTGDFESGNINGFHYLVPDTAFNTRIVNFPVRRGTFALKNTTRPEDFINNGYRAEFALYNCAKYKTEVYYGFSVMLDTGYSDMDFNLLCQWQDQPYYIQGEAWEPTPVLHGSSPPVALVYADGNLQLVMNENPNSDNNTFVVGNPVAINKGQWYDMIFHFYWNDEATAFAEAWIDGTSIIPFNGTDNKYYGRNIFNRTGNYFKFGQYRGHVQPAHTNTVYFDEVRIGTTYAEVAP